MSKFIKMLLVDTERGLYPVVIEADVWMMMIHTNKLCNFFTDFKEEDVEEDV